MKYLFTNQDLFIVSFHGVGNHFVFSGGDTGVLGDLIKDLEKQGNLKD